MALNILTLFVFLFSKNIYSQDIKITPDMYEFSKYSITGVYVCTPLHVKNGDCSDVDQEYYDNLARLTLGIYEIGLLEVNSIQTIAFKGPLSPGAAKNLISILEKYPDIKTLVLSSQGGSEEEAYLIADYVKEKNMNTWVPVRRMCLSACVPIFLSGLKKKIDGMIGLHSGEFFLADAYQIRNLEAARQLIKKALYESDQYMLKRVRLFLDLNISLDVIDAMILGQGEFLVFKKYEDLLNFDKNQNYQMSLKEMSDYAKNQSWENFDFNSYQQLF